MTGLLRVRLKLVVEQLQAEAAVSRQFEQLTVVIQGEVVDGASFEGVVRVAVDIDIQGRGRQVPVQSVPAIDGSPESHECLRKGKDIPFINRRLVGKVGGNSDAAHPVARGPELDGILGGQAEGTAGTSPFRWLDRLNRRIHGEDGLGTGVGRLP